MNRIQILLAVLAVLLAGAGYRYISHNKEPHSHTESSEAHGHAEEKGDDHTEEKTSTTITSEAAQASGIKTEPAGPQALRETLALNGKIILNPETSADIRARFPGIVRSVQKTVGQTVTKGEVVARVESNDSLQTYAVTSPLSGMVITRNANVGDTAADQPMFTVANLGTVVAEMHVFPQDLPRIRLGQTVQVQTADGHTKADGTIKALLPTADASTQTVIAWVVLNNEANLWRPGMVVQGGAVISQEEVPVAIHNEALQNVNNAPVIFIAQGNTYSARPIKTGRTDGTFTEVTEGLTAGESYVTTNSFIVKADLGKSGAEHTH